MLLKLSNQRQKVLLCKYNYIIFSNSTPKKLLSNEYINSMISPCRESGMKQITVTPIIHNNNIISSPDNDFRFNSYMKSKYKLFNIYYIF